MVLFSAMIRLRAHPSSTLKKYSVCLIFVSWSDACSRLESECISYLKLPTIVLACKSDLDRQVDPDSALSILEQYDIGLIQVTTTNPNGKQKIRTAFEWIFKAIVSQRRT